MNTTANLSPVKSVKDAIIDAHISAVLSSLVMNNGLITDDHRTPATAVRNIKCFGILNIGTQRFVIALPNKAHAGSGRFMMSLNPLCMDKDGIVHLTTNGCSVLDYEVAKAGSIIDAVDMYNAEHDCEGMHTRAKITNVVCLA